MQLNSKRNIDSWGRFEKIVRSSEVKLLTRLDDFQGPILVAGCQRSGTTALSRLITASDGMVDFAFGKDDELDAALILSGYVKYTNKGRYCFQTTYLNDSYPEYFAHQDYKLIWVIRQPVSVVYSMLNNWKTAALNRLFRRCGSVLLDGKEKQRFQRFGVLAVSRFRRACLSYNAKVAQVIEIHENLDRDRLMVIDYDELVQHKERLLPAIYSFVNLPYKNEYKNKLHAKSISKARDMSRQQANIIESVCMPVYNNARNYLARF